MNESKKRQHKQLLTLIAIIGYVIVLFMSLHMGTVKALDDSLDIFSVFVQGLTHMSDEPLRIIFSSYTFAYAGFMTLAFLFVIAWLYYDNIINGPGEKNAMGSAKWNTDFTAYNKKYTDPQGDPSNGGNNNMIISLKYCVQSRIRLLSTLVNLIY